MGLMQNVQAHPLARSPILLHSSILIHVSQQCCLSQAAGSVSLLLGVLFFLVTHEGGMQQVNNCHTSIWCMCAGLTLTEAQNINRSLLELGNVISALMQQSSHVPYRHAPFPMPVLAP